jgi:hypothetical protein
MEEEQNAAVRWIDEESAEAQVAALKAFEAWPKALHKGTRADRFWSVQGVALQTTLEDFQWQFPGSEVHPYAPDIPEEPDWKVGSVSKAEISGSFDMERRIRAIYGNRLEETGILLVRAGDTGQVVETQLGSPRGGRPWVYGPIWRYLMAL